mmetsp:Transcript_47468/g.143675  ORF Transcript_47468/g.143675 Transcript_47468/m.143675 type:complete len:85 (-) Transcript_47468:2049-2303(-)
MDERRDEDPHDTSAVGTDGPLLIGSDELPLAGHSPRQIKEALRNAALTEEDLLTVDASPGKGAADTRPSKATHPAPTSRSLFHK